MEKTERQRQIVELLQSELISSQEELRVKFEGLGVKVTQATLSRDLKELNVVKAVTEQGRYKYAILENWVGLPIRLCEVSGNLLVVHTDAGMAPAVAYKIDGMELAGVLGTVAGEDTLLAVVAEGYDARRVRKQLWEKVQTL